MINEQDIPEMLEKMSAYIHQRVAGGFDGEEDIREHAIDMLSDHYAVDALRPYAERLTREALAAHLREQATWPERTDCDRLDAVFAELERGGSSSHRPARGEGKRQRDQQADDAAMCLPNTPHARRYDALGCANPYDRRPIQCSAAPWRLSQTRAGPGSSPRISAASAWNAGPWCMWTRCATSCATVARRTKSGASTSRQL